MLTVRWPVLASLILAVSAIAVGAVDLAIPREALATRSYFYVGGQYVVDGTGMHFIENQMYVEQLVPQSEAKQKEPIVFIHGQAQTGSNWLNTPDNREGWASWFLRRGHTVYIVDQPQRGRSAYLPGDGFLAAYSAEYISRLFTGVQSFNLWPQAHLHTQWPGTGLRGDSIFDTFYASQVQFQNNTVTVQTNAQNAGAALLDRIGSAILITHSQGGPLGFLIADARPSLVSALISIEPQGPPFEDRVLSNSTAITRPYGLTNIPITYDPPVLNPTTDLPRTTIPPAGPGLSECNLQASPPRKLVNLAKIPQLVITSEASFHAGYDYCTANYLQQAGVSVEYLNLQQVGIHGNAHFLFIEKNNLEIAKMVEDWMMKVRLS